MYSYPHKHLIIIAKEIIESINNLLPLNIILPVKNAMANGSINVNGTQYKEYENGNTQGDRASDSQYRIAEYMPPNFNILYDGTEKTNAVINDITNEDCRLISITSKEKRPECINDSMMP